MADILTVETFDMTSLRNSEFFMFASEAGQILQSGLISRSASMNDTILSVLNVYNIEMEALDKAIATLNKSQLTDPISDADRNRDMAYRGTVLYVQAYAHSIDPEHREAARRLQVLINNYGDVRRRAYNTQSADMINLFQDIRQYNMADIETIGADYWLNSMEEANNTFMELMSRRYNESIEQASEDVRQVRVKVGRIYRQLVAMIEAGNLVSEGTAYVNIINQLNERVAYYKATLATRKGRADAIKDKEEGEDDPDDDGGEDIEF